MLPDNPFRGDTGGIVLSNYGIFRKRNKPLNRADQPAPQFFIFPGLDLTAEYSDYEFDKKKPNHFCILAYQIRPTNGFKATL
jgi:hypothetical protein